MELTLLVTREKSGLDRYSWELASRLPIRIRETKRYLKFSESLSLMRSLNSIRTPLHLPNQHFGRHALHLKIPFIITVHDLARLCYNFDPEPLGERIGLRLDKMGIRRASYIIAVSEHTKREIVRLLGIPSEKVVVIYNGIDTTVFRPRRRRYFNFPYILFVGSERPRKNLRRLLEAFVKAKAKFPSLKLVKVGTEGREPAFRRATLRKISELGIEKEVIFVEDVSDEELSAIYSGASALIYPSLYEGFGFPPLEAMACGCPAAVSNRTSIPEVVGDAALLFDPEDTSQMAEAIERILDDEKLRDRLREEGFRRVRMFSWDRAAEETLKLYKRLCEEVS